MARQATIKVLRTTRANLDAAASGSGLIAGEVYLITDEGRLAVSLGTGTYAALGRQIGTGTNDDAPQGGVGEHVAATVAVGSAISLTTGASADVTSISLTAGDWDVTGFLGFKTAASTSVSRLIGSLSTASATLDTTTGGAMISHWMAPVVPGANDNAFRLGGLGPIRLSLASTATLYLVANAAFTASALAAYGHLRARRMR